jgi:hypothetical protein
LLVFLEERTVTSCILEPQFDWTMWSKYLWGQHEKLFEQDVTRTFAARLAPAAEAS